MTYTMVAREKVDSVGGVQDVAECLGHECTSRHGATMKLARVLVAKGLPDGPVEVRSLSGLLRWSVKSLHAYAGKTITDSESGLGVRRWTPRTDMPFPAVP